MNQDFMISATPGNARRLVALAKLCRINLDEAIVEMAGTALITNFPPITVPAQREAIQFLADANHRGILLFDHLVEGKQTALVMSVIGGLSPVLILSAATRDRDEWRYQAAALGLKPVLVGAEVGTLLDRDYNVFIVAPEFAFDKELLKRVRGGLLVIDGECAQTEIADGLCIEFPHAIFAIARSTFKDMISVGSGLYRRNRVSDKWYQNVSIINIANRLWPHTGITSTLFETKFVLDDLMSRGFVMPHPRKMAAIFGVSTHLLREAQYAGDGDL